MISASAVSHLHRELSEVDPEVAALVDLEQSRQNEGLQLIASENVVSDAVKHVVGSCLTNKYAEGRAGFRYYSGCEHVDDVERLAEARAKELFKTDYHVNVQPHSGTQANLAVYLAVLKPGDKTLAMDLAMGGHLSHGFHINESGRLYDSHFYGVSRETEMLDYDEVERVAQEVQPQFVVCGASAYSRFIDFERFAAIAHGVGALLLADIAHIAGLVAAGVHPSPFGHADFVSTTTHKTLRGPRGGMVFCKPDLRKKLNSAVFPGCQGGPLMHQIAGKAVAFKEALEPNFREYQQQVATNARAVAGVMVERGYRIVSGGTDNHLMLVDLCGKVTGFEAEERLKNQRIFVNKNLIPFDTQSAKNTSGIRVGTPAMTARGLGEDEFRDVANLVCDVLDGAEEGVAARVDALTQPR